MQSHNVLQFDIQLNWRERLYHFLEKCLIFDADFSDEIVGQFENEFMSLLRETSDFKSPSSDNDGVSVDKLLESLRYIFDTATIIVYKIVNKYRCVCLSYRSDTGNYSQCACDLLNDIDAAQMLLVGIQCDLKISFSKVKREINPEGIRKFATEKFVDVLNIIISLKESHDQFLSELSSGKPSTV